MSFLKEIYQFIKVRKKFWSIPILLSLLIFGGLFVITQGTILNMTYILGISAFYHDSAAALIKDGKIISAAQEERFTRKKHDSSYPFNAVEFVLKYSNINLSNVDHIVFYEKPFL